MRAISFACILAMSITLCVGAMAQRNDPLRLPEVDRDEIINFVLYTISDNTLKLTAQLYPLLPEESRTLTLSIETESEWKIIATAEVIEAGWTVPFRVEDWDDTQDVVYRVEHSSGSDFVGRLRANPIDKEEIVVAAFTGNSVLSQHGGDISREDLIENVRRLDADLLFFSGDQVYNHTRHYEAWMKFGRDFRDIIRDRPTITIPDDHDAGQANLWGQGGKVSRIPGAADGGYAQPAAYVKEVERAQTSHLPDPYDPTPIGQGIGTYYTNLNWGRVSFAIIEDRKFKTGPASLFRDKRPRADHITDEVYDASKYDVPEAILLGERQLQFLDAWGQDWTGADFKTVLSQTIFAGGAHVHGKVGGRLQADLDSNGWPQTGRNKAIDAMRKSFALHIAGDQHLATIFHHGINEWRDSNVSFCVPSIANLYLRWWEPLTDGLNRSPNEPGYLGDHLDGLMNKVTCYAVANPDKRPNGGGKLTTRAAGFGVVRFNKKDRTITMECWPRNVDVTSADQYPGWPKTIEQTDNYGRDAVAWLPELIITGVENPVIQIVDQETGEWIYTLRIKGSKFRPKVFKDGLYSIKIGEGSQQSVLRDVQSSRTMDESMVLRIAL